MKKLITGICLSLVMAQPAAAAGMIAPEVLKGWLVAGKSLLLVDIQPAADFERQHIKGSLETNAFPAKTEDDTRRLAVAIAGARTSKDSVVIVCPRGKSGATKTYEHLRVNGVPEERLFILEGGIAGWPYPELMTTGR